jgi:hypothetical protein
MKLPPYYKMIDEATDGFMILLSNPSLANRNKAEGDILRLIRNAVRTRDPALIKSLHSGFKMALNSSNKATNEAN